MKRAVLITGARRLADTRGAERWARERIRETLTGAAYVITGDASGPDAYAIEIATDLNIAWTRYCLDGFVRYRDGKPNRWTVDDGERDRYPANRWPLIRDQRLVEAFGRSINVAYDSLALYAPWATTRGTGYTVGLLRKRGITVIEHTCPLEFKP